MEQKEMKNKAVFILSIFLGHSKHRVLHEFIMSRSICTVIDFCHFRLHPRFFVTRQQLKNEKANGSWDLTKAMGQPRCNALWQDPMIEPVWGFGGWPHPEHQLRAGPAGAACRSSPKHEVISLGPSYWLLPELGVTLVPQLRLQVLGKLTALRHHGPAPLHPHQLLHLLITYMELVFS